jgi:hypothetical protein
VHSDLLTFKLQKDQLPGKDRISKMILKSTSAVDLIASDLLDVAKGTYTTASSEWQNGSCSDVLYIPRLGIQKSLPPILIEVQLIVNEAFMQRLLQYCQIVQQLYKTYPLVLVFCTDKLSPSTLITKFKPVNNKPWMQSIICCDFWAKSCYLMSKSTLSIEEPDVSISPLLALSTFLLEQSPTLYGHSHPHYPTIQMLYRLAKESIEVEGEKEQGFVDIVDVICSNNERLLHKVEDSLTNVPGTLKTKKIVSCALEFNRSAKRKYVTLEDTDSSLEPLPSCSLRKITSEDSNMQDDFEFITNYRKNNIGKMNWSHCLQLAQEDDLCKRFSTVEGIRSFFFTTQEKMKIDIFIIPYSLHITTTYSLYFIKVFLLYFSTSLKTYKIKSM